MANTQTVTVNVLADTKRFSSSMKGAGNDTSLLTDAVKGFGVAAGVAFAAAVAGAIAFGAQSIKAAAEAEAISRGMQNAVKNAGLFGDTSTDIAKATGALDKHSKKVGELIGVDDELFNKIKTGWLAVPSLANLGTDGINKLAEVTADVAAGTGKDLQAIALAFTKVAGDTETALSKLTRQGIVLDDAQKDTYESLLETNGEAEAQAYLIEQLGNKYKGAAEATADPFKRLDVIFGNLSESIGLTFLPILEDTIPKIQEFIASLQDDPAFNEFLAGMATEFQHILEFLPTALENLQSFGRDALPVISAFFPLLNDALYAMGGAFGLIGETDPSSTTKTFAQSMQELADSMNNVGDAFRWIGDTLQWVNETWDSLPGWIKFIFSAGSGGGFGEIQKFFDAVQSGNIGTIRNYLNIPNLSGVPSGTMGGGRGVKLAEGGIVMPQPGGVLANIAEDGQAEAVIPLDRLGKFGQGQTIYNITVSGGLATGSDIGRSVVNAIRDFERQSGTAWRS